MILQVFLCLATVLFTTGSCSCRLVDITSIIGGDQYTVNGVQVVHMDTSVVNFLFVAATIKKDVSPTSSLVIYMVDYSVCQSYFQQEIPQVSSIMSLKENGDRVAMLIQNTSNETILIFRILENNGLLSAQLMDTFVYTATPDTTAQLINVVLARVGDIGIGPPQVYVVFNNKIRIYAGVGTAPSSPTLASFTQTGSSIKAFEAQRFPLPKIHVMLSVTTTQSSLSFWSGEEFGPLTYGIKLSQGHNGQGRAMIALHGDMATTLSTAWVIYQMSGNTSTFVAFVQTQRNPMPPPPPAYPYTASMKKQWVINKKLNVLTMQIDGVTLEVKLLAVDQSFVIYSFSINSANDSLIKFKTGTSNSMLTAYAASSAAIGAFSVKNWDDYVWGITTSFDFNGTPFTFTKSVGFVMGLNQNRVNQILSNTPPSITLTTTVPTLTEQTTVQPTASPKINLPPFDNSLATFVPFTQKNSWIKFQPVCRSYTDSFKSYCYNYSFLTNWYKNFIDTTNPTVPTLPNKCPEAEKFSPLNFRAYTVPEQTMRATCFPYFHEETSMAIPAYSSSAMLYVDQSSFTVRWNETAHESVVGNTWTYYAFEKTDDGSYGFEGQALFSTVGVTNNNVTLSSDRSWMKTLVVEASWPDYSMQVQCWSLQCPNFVHVNPQNFSIWTLASETYGRPVNGTYIYMVQLTKLSTGIVTTSTYTLQMILASLSTAAQKININLPFDVWYEVNKFNLPFYAPPLPKTPDIDAPMDEQALIDEYFSGDTIQNIVQNFGQSSIDVLAQWTPKDFAIAYEEARQRITKPKYPITVKSKLDAEGLLTIAFNFPVSFPSYLTKSFTSSQPLANGRNLGVFWNDNGYVVNESLGQRNPPAVAPPPIKGSVDPNAPPPTNESQFTTTNTNSQAPPPTGSTSIQPPPSTAAQAPPPNSGGTQPPSGGQQPPKDSGTQPPGGGQQPPKDSGTQPPGGGQQPPKDSGTQPPGGGQQPPKDSGTQPPGGGQPPPQNDGNQPPNGQQPQDNKKDPQDPGQQGPNDPKVQEQNFTTNKKDDNPKQVTCSEQEYLDKIKNVCIPLQIYFGTFEQLFSVQLEPSDAGEVTEEDAALGLRRLNLEYTQEIISLTETEIQVKFNFTNPLDVTPKDQIRVWLNFGVFEPGLEQNQEISTPCTRQIVQGQGADTVAALSQASTVATTAAVVGSAILQTVMSGCLAQVWGMINGMQFIIHLPAINVEFPSNAMVVVKKILLVATFDIPYVTMESVPKVFPLPTDDDLLTRDDQQNIKASLDDLGYSSAYASNNLGSVYIIALIIGFGLILSLLLSFCTRFTIARWLHTKLKNALYWNFVIRFILEAALEISFCAYFNFYYGEFKISIFGCWFNYISIGIMISCLVLLPFFILDFYLATNFYKINSEEFEAKYGSVYEGLKKEKKLSLIYPVYFIIRRMLFMCISLLMYKYVIIQILLMLLITMVEVIYIIEVQPFEEPLMNHLEIVTECFTLMLIDLTYFFTPLCEKVQMQYNLGYAFVIIMCLCIFYHLFFLMKDLVQTLLLKLRRRLMKRKHPERFKEEVAAERYCRENRQVVPLTDQSVIDFEDPEDPTPVKMMKIEYIACERESDIGISHEDVQVSFDKQNSNSGQVTVNKAADNLINSEMVQEDEVIDTVNYKKRQSQSEIYAPEQGEENDSSVESYNLYSSLEIDQIKDLLMDEFDAISNPTK